MKLAMRSFVASNAFQQYFLAEIKNYIAEINYFLAGKIIFLAKKIMIHKYTDITTMLSNDTKKT